jgi:aspartyl/asparaginyl beta-hydroxylase (cupin superfamily)
VGAREQIYDLTNSVGDRLLQGVNRVIGRQSELPLQPFYEPADFPWVAPLEANWKAIRAELDAVLAHRASLPNFQDISVDQYQLTDDDRWKTFFFYGYGFRSDANCDRCPETTRLIEAIPGMETAMFSILASGKHIPPHDGPYKGVLRYHLGLAVPDVPLEQLGIRVGTERRAWHEGESLVFDDTYEHEVWNQTDETRVVLFVDVVRPLRQPMRSINSGIIKAIGWSPFIQDAKRRHQAWEEQFTRETGTSETS